MRPTQPLRFNGGRFLPLAVALALLSACDEQAADAPELPGDDGRGASGEVLEGTISDAMIPLDQLRSQPPLAANQPDPADGNGARDTARTQPDSTGVSPVIQGMAAPAQAPESTPTPAAPSANSPMPALQPERVPLDSAPAP